MKIYQIIKATGCYEDYHEYVQATYLSKERAENELARLKASVPDCDDCPYSEEGQESPLETNCQFHKPKYINHNDGWAPYYECENCVDPYDAPSYRMQEHEVTDSWKFIEEEVPVGDDEIEVDSRNVGKKISTIVYTPMNLKIYLGVRNNDEIYISKIVVPKEIEK